MWLAGDRLLVQGWWRPLASHGALVLLVAAFMALRGGGSARAFVVTALIAFLVIVPLRLAWWVSASRFVAGLREAGPARVTRDEASWFGQRSLTVVTAAGEWSVLARTGKYGRLDVKGPAMREAARVKGNPRRAGREAAQAGALPASRVRA